MRLTSAQITRVREADTRYHSEIASRGADVVTATEVFVEGVLEAVRGGVAPGPSALVPCGAIVDGRQCGARSDFLADGGARCMAHRKVE